MTRRTVSNALRRLHSAELWNTTIEVYEPTETWDGAGDGYDTDYPDTPDATHEARVETPSENAEKERSGTMAEADAVVRVRDDTGQQWVGWGEDGEATVEIVDTTSGERYEVQTVVDEHNGIVQLGVAEL